MAKNYKAIFESVNDSIALEQKFFIKEETTRGVLETPISTDFLFTLSGGSVNFKQDIENSPHRSGRHMTNIIKKKTTTEWTLPLYFNIDEALPAISLNEIDSSARVLYKSLMGNEDVTSGGLVYNTKKDPSTTFTMLEIGDQWAKQASGCFVESGNASFAGDGESQIEFAGNAKTSLTVGMSKTVIDNNGANTITVAVGGGACFPKGAKVMLIKDDGLARSADTPDGSPRTVVSVTGDVVTLDGAVLADADGSAGDYFLTYYEPATATAINNPVTGLQGSISIVGLSSTDCVRSASLNMANNHELQDFCFGEEGLGGRLFTAGGQFTAELTVELNLNKEIACFLNNIKDFAGEDITIILGDATGRHLQILVPKVIFPIPEISVPDTGSIPISFVGKAQQTALDVADEVTLKFL